VWLWESDDWAIQYRSLHCPPHHSITQEGSNTVVGVLGIGVAEVFAERHPIHGVVCLEKSEVGKESVECLSVLGTIESRIADKWLGCPTIFRTFRNSEVLTYSSNLFSSGVPDKHQR
jgi:hypothetical protein